jgi:signal transduction histidine kinase
MTWVQPASLGVRRPRGPVVAGSGLVDLSAGVLLSVAVFVIVHVDLYASDPHGTVLDGLAATSMTLPVVWARRAPLPAAAVLALGGVLNWVFVGHFIRCGAGVPAAFWVACAIGWRLRGRPALLGILLVLVDLQALCLADAALIPISILPLAPMTVAFWFAGRTIRARTETIARLAEQNQHLVETRERTAQLAVDTDRRRISDGLERQLQQQIGDLASTATAGRDRVADPPAARAAFGAISEGGRTALTQMRDLVDSLRAEAPRRPPPDLARLDELVGHCGGTLTVDGDTRPLPGGIELAGYRVVEQLLRTFVLDPPAVHVHFGADALELRVTGRPLASPPFAAPAKPAAAPIAPFEPIEPFDRLEPLGPEVAVARHRLEVHGGTLVANREAGRLQWIARVPLTAGG